MELPTKSDVYNMILHMIFWNNSVCHKFKVVWRDGGLYINQQNVLKVVFLKLHFLKDILLAAYRSGNFIVIFSVSFAITPRL